jgi:acetamidase/formamidase
MSNLQGESMKLLSGDKRVVTTVLLNACFAMLCGSNLSAQSSTSAVLQPLANKPGPAPATLHTGATYYVPVTLETIRWGYLPDAQSKPILTVPSGSVITFDTISHEGILEDQGRDPIKYFAQFGVPASSVLKDAQEIAASALAHDFAKDGPHIEVGPVDVEGAEPGDILKIDMISMTPRVPYGVISNRHGKGALPNEMPEGPSPDPAASTTNPALYHNVSKFVSLETIRGKLYCVIKDDSGHAIHFPAAPFHGTIGLAPNVTGKPNSIPPGVYGGNLDIRYLTRGSTLYLPVQVQGAKFFISDPHFAQGNGEVALTAVEGSLRSTVRLTVLKFHQRGYPSKEQLSTPFAETEEYWIPIGLDPDLNEAMKQAVRNAVSFLAANQGMDRATAFAYLSGATDFEVSQVVDRTKGVHGLIRKRDFEMKVPPLH